MRGRWIFLTRSAMPGKGQDQLSIMHCFRGGFIAALSFIFVHARSQDLYSFDSSAPNLNDPASDDLFLDSPELYDFSSDDTADPLNEDSTTGSWDLASLPSCDAQSSLTDDFLQARDGNSCPTREQDGSLDLPTGLFQDPLQLWDNGLKTPPVGQNNQPDVGSKDGDFDFRAFVNSRPKSILNYPDDEKTCPPEIYGLSITPVCHYPDRGSSVSVGGLTLHDVTPYMRGIKCLRPSLLWCCKDIVNRASDRSFAHEGQIDISEMTDEQAALFFGLLHGYYDAFACFRHWQEGF